MLFTCQKKSAFEHGTAKLQHTVASSKTRVPQDLITNAIVSYGKCGSLGDVGAFVKHAVCDNVVMLVYSRFDYLAFVTAHLSGHLSEG
jgi:hypothetical protein